MNINIIAALRISFCTHSNTPNIHSNQASRENSPQKRISTYSTYYLVVRAHEYAVGGVVVQVVPDHDGQGVSPGGRLPHPLQGPLTAIIVLRLISLSSGDRCSPRGVIIDAVPADHGGAAVDLGAEEGHHQRRPEGRGHGDW